MKTVFTSEYPSSACMPSSRPKPDCLNPPNGVCTRTEPFELTEMAPVSSARATRIARAPSRVQIEPESPYGVSFAMRIASASSSNGISAATSQISYTASKGAVLSMSRELAVQFARQGVRVNALCPGPVETPLLMRLFDETPGAYERRRVHLPMGRLAQAKEIAYGALFLASDESSYVNGATFVVDGGLTAAYVTPE